MENFQTATAFENEILKASDFSFGYDAGFKNAALALRMLVGGEESFCVGGKVKPYENGGLNVSVEPIFAFCKDNDSVGVFTQVTEPVSFDEAHETLDRIDTLQVKIVEEGFDTQTRMFVEPATNIKSVQSVDTKKKVSVQISAKRGSAGSAYAPDADKNCIKIAEVHIPAGLVNISEENIKNITARKSGIENKDWTVEKDKTYNPTPFGDVSHLFYGVYDEDGGLLPKAIKAEHLDTGTGSNQIRGSIIPVGEASTLNGLDVKAVDSITTVLLELIRNINALYPYANELFNRYSFLKDKPIAVSTENVDIITGGEIKVDGVPCYAGQMVLLVGQDDAVENGFWEVQTGEWNRYEGYTEVNPDAFTHKLVFSDAGEKNAGKVFYLPGDTYFVGFSPLNFIESRATTHALPESFVLRDITGDITARVLKSNEKKEAPLQVESTKEVKNLNANFLQGRSYEALLNEITHYSEDMPTEHDDESKGYKLGQQWFCTKNNTCYRAYSVEESKAVWCANAYTISGILKAGQTKLVLEDKHLTDKCFVDVYCSKYGVNPLKVEVVTTKQVKQYTVDQATGNTSFTWVTTPVEVPYVELEFSEEVEDLRIDVRVS